MPAPASITVPAHAKINLALRVGPPQPPRGYHSIASWFAAIDLHDDLTITPLSLGTPSRLEIRWAADAPRPTPLDWPIEKDLVHRAHALLEASTDRYGRRLPCAMALEKRIPVGGGLGGGSSDAAAALIGLKRVFNLGVSTADLRALSTELGSDVAFFIDECDALSPTPAPRPALVTGLGELVERVESPGASLLLMFPPFGCPTGAVYKAFHRPASTWANVTPVRDLIASANRSGLVDPGSLFNDLAEPACIVEPRLRTAIADLQRAVGAARRIHVTGSGSTLFTLVQDSTPDALAVRCRAARPDIAVIPARLVGSG